MRNRIMVCGDIVCVYIKCKGKTYNCFINLDSLYRIKDINCTWYGHLHYATDLVYVRANYKGKFLQMHRVITNAPDTLVVDHIDHDTLNNRLENLRLVTIKENSNNRRADKVKELGKSGYRGITWNESRNKWQVYIKVNGKRKSHGYFVNLQDAVMAQSEATLN